MIVCATMSSACPWCGAPQIPDASKISPWSWPLMVRTCQRKAPPQSSAGSCPSRSRRSRRSGRGCGRGRHWSCRREQRGRTGSGLRSGLLHLAVADHRGQVRGRSGAVAVVEAGGERHAERHRAPDGRWRPRSRIAFTPGERMREPSWRRGHQLLAREVTHVRQGACSSRTQCPFEHRSGPGPTSAARRGRWRISPLRRG